MAYSPEIVALATEAQRQHQALINEANQRTSTEARFQIADDLNGARRAFVGSSIAALGLTFPMQLNPLGSEDHALVAAINDDFEDSIAQLKALRDQATLYKTIKSVTGGVLGNVDAPDLPDVKVPWFIWAAAALLVVLALRPR